MGSARHYPYKVNIKKMCKLIGSNNPVLYRNSIHQWTYFALCSQKESHRNTP